MSVHKQKRETQNDTFQSSIFVEVCYVVLPDDGRDFDTHPPIRIWGRLTSFPLREEREPRLESWALGRGIRWRWRWCDLPTDGTRKPTTSFPYSGNR